MTNQLSAQAQEAGEPVDMTAEQTAHDEWWDSRHGDTEFSLTTKNQSRAAWKERAARPQPAAAAVEAEAFLRKMAQTPGTAIHSTRDLSPEMVAAVRAYGDWLTLRDGLAFAILTEGSVLAGSPAPEQGDAARDVLAERERQKSVEGWTPEHDDEHDMGELIDAAAAYAMVASAQTRGASADEFTAYMAVAELDWPWDEGSWKPREARRNLVRAAALILAEIERIDRAAAAPTKDQP